MDVGGAMTPRPPQIFFFFLNASIYNVLKQFVSINLHFTPLNNIIDLFKSYKKFIDKLKNISLRANLSPNNFQNKPTQGSQKKKKRKRKEEA